MKANEIRDRAGDRIREAHCEAQLFESLAWSMAEISAQLAELNATLKAWEYEEDSPTGKPAARWLAVRTMPL